VQTDKSMACGITKDNMKQQCSQAINMCYIGYAIVYGKDNLTSTGNQEGQSCQLLYQTPLSCAPSTSAPALSTYGRQYNVKVNPIMSVLHVLQGCAKYCQGFRASRTFTPMHLPTCPPAHHCVSTASSNSTQAMQWQSNPHANRLISFLACFILHPFAS
jgi:hypothetical protein